MARTAQWFTIGLAITLAALAGCSNPRSSTPSQSSSQSSAQQADDSPDSAAKSADGKTDARVVNDVKIPPGTDPLAMVFSTRQPSDPAGSEQIRVTYPAADKATVILTKTGLKDDSVAAIRTRYEFKPSDAAAEGAKQWQLVQVTQQNKCQKGRGSQDWVGAACQ